MLKLGNHEQILTHFCLKTWWKNFTRLCPNFVQKVDYTIISINIGVPHILKLKVIFVFVNIEIFGYLFSTSQSTITNHINQILITCNTKYTITLHQHPSHNILFWWIWKIKDKTLLLSENRIDGLRCSVISRRSVKIMLYMCIFKMVQFVKVWSRCQYK
jgi:hypothetical protein